MFVALLFLPLLLVQGSAGHSFYGASFYRSTPGSPRRDPQPNSIDGVFRKASNGSASRTMTRRVWGGREEIQDGYDMVLSPEQYQRLYEGKKTRGASRIIATPWTNGVIPYTIREGDFTAEQKDWILRAMDVWSSVTCIRFRKATSSDVNQVEIQTGSGCWAHLGMMGGNQIVNLDPLCFWKGTIEHELGHLIGMIHEHQRPQRDAYIRVNYYALSSTSIGSLTKYARGSDDKMGLDYDYKSVMHYGKTAFAEDWMSQTIFTRDPSMEDTIGMTMGPSFLDSKLVNLMYRCHDKCSSPRRCDKDCFLNEQCQCVCEQDMPKEKCEDKDPQCQKWATTAECAANAFFMHTACRKSCQICNDDGSPAHLPCFNADTRCKQWAETGECDSNPNYMLKSCAAACGQCEEGWGKPAVQGPCRDKKSKSDCQARVAKGECDRKPAEMLEDCRESCDFCQENIGIDPSDKPGCTDFDTVCQYQADFGYCRKLYASLAVECRQHCGTCDVQVDIPADCVDDNVACRSWAANGDCDSNFGYMNKTCRLSCNLCGDLDMPDSIANQCVDGNPKCESWASAGECSKNAIWMKLNCPKSCAVCGDLTPPDRCINWDKQCDSWASRGECTKNQAWMYENCPVSCDQSCHNYNGAGDSSSGGSDSSCVDSNDGCPGWAAYGECDKNPGYMLSNCKKSCNQCSGGGSDSSCVDSNDGCPGWAAYGECNKNPGYMHNNCKKSCNKC